MNATATFGALGSAACFGAGDFVGGVATRRLRATSVVAISHAVSLLLLVPVAVVAGAARVGLADLAWGILAGLVGGIGVALLYSALARGVMSVVAPVTAACGAILPVLVGVVLGDRPHAAAFVGVALALVAVVLLGRDGEVGAGARGAVVALSGALGAGACFGLVYVVLSRPSPDSGLWSLVSQRSTSTLLFAAVTLCLTRSRSSGSRGPGATLLLAVAACGVLDTTANILYVTGVRQGLLSLAAVLSSLYPAGTVLLARLVLGERLAPGQALGLGLAVVAVPLIAL